MAFWNRKKSEKAPEDRFTMETLRDVLTMLTEDSEDDWISHKAYFDSEGSFIASGEVSNYEIEESQIKVDLAVWKTLTKT